MSPMRPSPKRWVSSKSASRTRSGRHRSAMTASRQHLGLEDSEDALVDGDPPFVPGTAMDALRMPVFRTVFFGAFASNIGTWMQNAVLMGYAFSLTHSAAFVGLIVFAQLGPLLFLSVIGGWFADV